MTVTFMTMRRPAPAVRGCIAGFDIEFIVELENPDRDIDCDAS